uniref:Uncharacterized protein n=1 Tax=Arundo donax TaxID=35708 RepID=A0A0A9H9Q3_ARUDO
MQEIRVPVITTLFSLSSYQQFLSLKFKKLTESKITKKDRVFWI